MTIANELGNDRDGDKRLILHIGHHKTGTKSIQLCLAEAYDALRAQGVLYPKAGRTRQADQSPDFESAHHALALAFADGSEAALAKLAEFKRQLDEEAQGCNTVILSSEAFPTIKATGQVARFFSDYSIEVVCYFREHLSYVVSAYASDVITGRTAAAFSDYAKIFVPNPNWITRPWSQVTSNCTWRLFDRTALKGGTVVTDFVQTVGIDIPTSASYEQNPSISGNLLAFKLLVNLCGCHSYDQFVALRNLAEAEPRFRGKIRISAAEQDHMRTRNEANHVLRELVGEVPLSDYTNGNEVFEQDTLIADFSRISQLMNQFPTIAGHPLLSVLLNHKAQDNLMQS